MKNNKNDLIFYTNNILLSAFGDKADIKSFLTEENDRLKQDVSDAALKTCYEKIKKGDKTEIKFEHKENMGDILLLFNQGEYATAFDEFARLLKQDPDCYILQRSVANALLRLQGYDVIKKKFFPVLKSHTDDIEALTIIANTYMGLENFKQAAKHYEEILKRDIKGLDRTNCYSRLSYLYERVYQDKNIDTQIEYTKKGLGLTNKDASIYAFLGRLYFRKGDIETADKCFKLMYKNNPTVEDEIKYARFLMKQGKITEGFDIMRKRFQTGQVKYPIALKDEKRWDGRADLSKSTIIVHYEQGFGDSVMFSRYIPELSKKAEKVIFVVQKNLIPLFKDSGFDNYCEILSHEADVNPNITLNNGNRSVMYSNGEGMSRIRHDYHVPVMDLPYVMKESSDKMKEAGGYLSVPQDKIEKFRKKYIKKNDKIKIGLAYHGTKDSIQTYRDIPPKKFLPIFRLKGVEFYSFQADEYAKQLKTLDKSIKVYDLAKHFKDFEDTACAMNCMDLIISTDNVVMNLAGALGLKAYGLFNVFSESRWYKTEGEDIGWYKSVKPFRAKTFNDWDNLIEDVRLAIKKDFNL